MLACRLITAILMLSGAAAAAGASLDLHAVAHVGSRFVSHSFDGLFELGRTRDSTRVDEPDGAFHYSELPDYVPLGGGGTAFPEKSNFLGLGSIEYDDSTGEITALQADFARFIAPGRFTFYQGVSGAPAYATSFNSVSGVVSDVGEGVPTVNLASEVVFSVDGSAVGDGILTYTGRFDIVDNAVVLAVDDTAFSQAFAAGFGDGSIRLEWDVSAVVGILGDFNDNGLVDAADYTVWRGSLGATSDLNGVGDEIGDSQGVVDRADYARWAENYGAGFASATGGPPAIVPEPAAAFVAALCWAIAGVCRIARTNPEARPWA